MTAADRKKLAKAARELASDFAEGRGPTLQPYDYCGCVAGEVVKRGLGLTRDTLLWITANRLDNGTQGILTRATFIETGKGSATHLKIPGAVVFPLLWLATELDGKIV